MKGFSFVCLLLFVFVSYVGMPVYAPGFFPGMVSLICFVSIAVAILLGIINERAAFSGAIIFCGLLVVAIFMMIFSTWSLFHSSSYRGLIGNIKESVFTEDIAPIDPTQIRIVDQSMAYRLGVKKLGEDPALGSRAELGMFNIQSVGGELYWVAPILHSGFFKWFKYESEGTPGYVKVSATNERDVTLVREIHNKPIRITYQPNAYFDTYLERHLYFNGFMTRGLDDYTFEIDDNGRPYYVVTIYDKTVGFAGNNATGVAVVDVQTGDIKEYSIADAPIWIDRIQPENFITTQLNDWGKFVHGWLNPSNKDRLQTSPGMSLVYGSNGKSYWYTGMTSWGSDDSTVGFVLIDTRTKEASWYKQAGATESAAMSSAQGKVQEKRYHSTFPVLYNVSGLPTYAMALKDDAGLVKMISLVSVEDYTVVGVGDNTAQALRNYQSTLASKGNTVAFGGEVERVSYTGTVMRIAVEPKSGVYVMVFNDIPRLFFTSADTNRTISLTQPGDTVSITFVDTGHSEVDVLSFENKDIMLSQSDAEKGVTKRFEKKVRKK